VLLDRKSIPLIEIDIKSNGLLVLRKEKKCFWNKNFTFLIGFFSAKRSETKEEIE